MVDNDPLALERLSVPVFFHLAWRQAFLGLERSAMGSFASANCLRTSKASRPRANCPSAISAIERSFLQARSSGLIVSAFS